MSHKSLIIALLALLAVSFVCLAFVESRAKDPNLNKNWWALYFVDPHDSKLDFTIENHSDATNFTYTVSEEKGIFQEKSISISKGESKTITLGFEADPNERMTVSVKPHQQTPKEIYK